MRIDTPPLRRLARRIGRPAPLVTLAILLASPAVLARQSTTPEDLARQAAIAAAMESVPLQIGNWVGTTAEIPTDQTEILNPNAILSRRYSEIGSREQGTDVTMLLVHCSNVRDMDGHWPLHCYPKSGWRLDEFKPAIMVTSGAGSPIPFAWSRFTIANSSASVRTMTVLYTFVLPEGRIETDMAKVSDRSTRKSDSAKGVAQFQFVFSGDIPPERCAVVAGSLIAGVPLSLRTRLGMPMEPTNRASVGTAVGAGGQSTPAADAGAKKEQGDAESER